MKPFRLIWMSATLLASLASAQVASLPPPNVQQTEHVQLLKDSSFEEPEAGAWRFSDWPPRPDTGARLIANSVYVSDSVVHDGERAACFDLTTVGQDRILLAQQRFGVDRLAPHDGRRVRLSAWIWVAQGPSGCQGRLTLRQWGKPGTPPLSHATVSLPGVRGEWSHGSTEFVLRVGETTRGDVGVGLRQVPDLTQSPVVYIDDISLEVLASPAFEANLLCGKTLYAPDKAVPVRLSVSSNAWSDGLRFLQWDLTATDGRTSHAHGTQELSNAQATIEIDIDALPPGMWAARLALGRAPRERTHERLLPFQKVDGPFARWQETAPKE